MATREDLISSLIGTMKDMSEEKVRLLALFYGTMGTGKTTLAMHVAQRVCPPGKKIAYVDTHQGWAVLRRHEDIVNMSTRFQYKGFSQLKLMAELISEGHPRFKDFGVVVCDEASWMAYIDLDRITRSRAANDKDKDPDEPKYPDMLAGQHRWIDMQEALTASGVHLILISHDRDDKDDRQIIVKGPAFQPMLMPKVCQPLHVVGHVTASLTDRDGTPVYDRTVQVHPSRRVIAKCRIDNMNVQVSHNTMITACGEFVSGERSLVKESEAVTLSSEHSGQFEVDPAIVVD